MMRFKFLVVLMLILPPPVFCQIQDVMTPVFSQKLDKAYYTCDVSGKVQGEIYLQDDTLIGLIELLEPIKMETQVHYYALNDVKLKVFTPRDILGYKCACEKGVAYYKTMKMEDLIRPEDEDEAMELRVFVLVMETGKINLYGKLNLEVEYSPTVPTSYGNTPGSIKKTIKLAYVLKFQNEQTFIIPIKKWKKELALFLNEYPSLAEMVNKNKFKPKDVPAIIKEYNRLEGNSSSYQQSPKQY